MKKLLFIALSIFAIGSVSAMQNDQKMAAAASPSYNSDDEKAEIKALEDKIAVDEKTLAMEAAEAKKVKAATGNEAKVKKWAMEEEARAKEAEAKAQRAAQQRQWVESLVAQNANLSDLFLQAASEGRYEQVEALATYDPNVLWTTNKERGHNALHAAIYSYFVTDDNKKALDLSNTVSKLVELGIDKTQITNEGKTAEDLIKKGCKSRTRIAANADQAAEWRCKAQSLLIVLVRNDPRMNLSKEYFMLNCPLELHRQLNNHLKTAAQTPASKK